MLTISRTDIGVKNVEAIVSSNTFNPAGKEEGLPFTIRLVKNSDDLLKAVQIRHAAYMRHVPDFAQSLAGPETADLEKGVVVLLAESKLDGTPVGTMRIQTNEFEPLKLEKTVKLPPRMSGQRLAEATRLGVAQERGGRMVTTALFKAFYLYCKQHEVDHMVITARAPVDRQYDRLLFKDIYPELGYMPFQHVGNMPHRVMSLKVDDVFSLWEAARHPLFNFFFNTYHEDINVMDIFHYQVRRSAIEQAAQVVALTA
jgi:hypothetical protein